jgi:hypothetical protein
MATLHFGSSQPLVPAPTPFGMVVAAKGFSKLTGIRL